MVIVLVVPGFCTLISCGKAVALLFSGVRHCKLDLVVNKDTGFLRLTHSYNLLQDSSINLLQYHPHPR